MQKFVYEDQYKKTLREFTVQLTQIDGAREILEAAKLHDQVLPLDISSENIDQLNFFAFPWGEIKPYENRASALYLTETKTIILNDKNQRQELADFFHRQTTDAGPFKIHEFISAFGRYDLYYEVSTAIWWVQWWAKNNPGRPQKNERVFQALGRYLKKLDLRGGQSFRVAGGATVVSGGGDLDEIAFKAAVLRVSAEQSYPSPLAERLEERILFAQIKKHSATHCPPHREECYGYTDGTLFLPEGWFVHALANRKWFALGTLNALKAILQEDDKAARNP